MHDYLVSGTLVVYIKQIVNTVTNKQNDDNDKVDLPQDRID